VKPFKTTKALAPRFGAIKAQQAIRCDEIPGLKRLINKVHAGDVKVALGHGRSTPFRFHSLSGAPGAS
jgi:hypothetical protein